MGTVDDDPLADPSYQAFLEETAKTCRARDKPCPGCCAGGMCDGDLGGTLSEDYEPDDEDPEAWWAEDER